MLIYLVFSLGTRLMHASNKDIITRLRNEILPLQGYKQQLKNSSFVNELGVINDSFPGGVFPLGAIHEFIVSSVDEAAPACGFIAGILSSLPRDTGVLLWISASRTLFPPAIKFFGIEPEKIIFIDLQKDKEVLWAAEEALKCEGLTAVIAELKDLNFTVSRRLQLAVESSGVTGFILHQSKSYATTACITRWRITPAASQLNGEMPGVGCPRWKVELLKVRNGKTGSWNIEWAFDKFQIIPEENALHQELHKKTG